MAQLPETSVLIYVALLTSMHPNSPRFTAIIRDIMPCTISISKTIISSF